VHPWQTGGEPGVALVLRDRDLAGLGDEEIPLPEPPTGTKRLYLPTDYK
jgi:hypothetical protein